MELRPLLSHLLRLDGPVSRGMDRPRRPRPGHPATPAGHLGDRHPLPAPRRAGQHGRHRGHHLRGPAGAGHRRRVERGGVERLRHRTRNPQAAQRPLRRSVPGAGRPALPGDHDVRRRLLPGHRRALRAQAAPATPPAHLHRRQRRAPHAANRRPLRPTLELRGRHDRRVPNQGRCLAPALRSDRPRPRRDPPVQSRPLRRRAQGHRRRGGRTGRSRVAAGDRVPAPPLRPDSLASLADALAPLAGP